MADQDGSGPSPQKQNPLRMYLFMRGDLGSVPPGKLMVQAGHAFAHCLLEAWQVNRGLALEYCKDPEHQKIALRVTDAELTAVHGLAVDCDLPSHVQVDLAKTI